MALALFTHADKGSCSKEDARVEGICVTAGERSAFCAKRYLFLTFLDLRSRELVFQCISCFTISQLFFMSNECQ